MAHLAQGAMALFLLMLLAFFLGPAGEEVTMEERVGSTLKAVQEGHLL